MARSPLSTAVFRNLFIACWLVWALLQVRVLVWYGIAVNAAIIDSSISNILLVGSCILIMCLFRYYLPQNHRYSYILSLCLMLTAIWFFSSRVLVLILLPKQPDYATFFCIPLRCAWRLLF